MNQRRGLRGVELVAPLGLNVIHIQLVSVCVLLPDQRQALGRPKWA